MKRAKGLKQVTTALFTSLVIFLVTFPKFVPDYGVGLDPSYIWALNYLFNHDYHTLTNLIYPIGPLGFLKYTAAFENNLLAGLLFFSLAKLGFIYLLFQLTYLQKSRLTLPSFLLILVVAYFSGIDFSIVGSTIVLLIFAIKKPNNYVYFILANLIALIGLCIKSSIGIAAYSSVFTYLLIVIFTNQSGFKKSGILVLISTFIFIVGGFIVFQGINSFLNFLLGLLHLAGGYTSGLALFPDNNWWLLSGFILTTLCFPFLIKKRNQRIVFLLLALPLFAMWKHAMGREDVSHIFVLPTFLFVFWGIIFLVSEKFKPWYVIFPILSIYFFDANIKSVNLHSGYDIHINGISNFNEAIINYSSFNEKYITLSINNLKPNKLDISVTDLVGDKLIDVYPWDLSYVPANGFKWQPRKTLELGAANSQWLSAKNAFCFEKEIGPEFVLLHLNKDKWGGSLGSLDGRYLLNDEPLVVFNFLKNYKLKTKNEQLLLLQKSNSELSQKSLKKEIIDWNTWTKVPKNDKLTRVKFYSDKTFLLQLKSFLFKDEGYFIDYRLDDGRILSYRFIASNAADGLWINPLVLIPENDKPSSIVNQIRFRSTNINLMADEISLEWESIDIFVNEYFWKTDTLKNNFVLQVTENYDSVTTKNIKVDSEFSFSGKFSEKLASGAYSSSIKILLDTLWKEGINRLKVETSLMFLSQNPENKNAVLIISVQDSEKDFWKSVPLSTINNIDEWNFAYLSETINFVDHHKGSLSIYVWNNGTSDVYIDNFSKIIQSK